MAVHFTLPTFETKNLEVSVPLGIHITVSMIDMSLKLGLLCFQLQNFNTVSELLSVRRLYYLSFMLNIDFHPKTLFIVVRY